VILPVRRGANFLADVAAANLEAPDFHLWWLGQSGFLVQWRNQHLLNDPYLSDSLTKKYAATDKPHVRMTERVVEPEELDFIDVVSSSHNHTDHLDPDTLQPLLRVNPAVKLVIPEANRRLVAERLAIDPACPFGVDDGSTVTVAGFEFIGVAAAHEQVERDDLGRSRFLGYMIRFGRWALYHSGDTVRYDGMIERLRRWKIDVALLPINGRAAERRVPGNLNGREAAVMAKEMGARLVIPCHYEMFEFNTASPDEFVAEAQKLTQPYRILRCCERWSSSELEAG